MLDLSGNLAVIQYSAGVDIDPHRAMLMNAGVECEPINPRDLLVVPRHVPLIYIINPLWWREQSKTIQLELLRSMERLFSATIVCGLTADEIPPDLEALGVITAWLDMPISAKGLRSAVQTALRTVRLRVELSVTQHELQQRLHEMEEMHRVGIALSTERDLSALQELVLRTSREVTSADAGTLYLIEENAQKERVLVFHVSQNDTIQAPYERQELPLDTRSIAGFVASTGQALRLNDVYQLPLGVSYSFNPALDQAFGYRTRSMLVVPMVNHDGMVIGVIQLINRKRSTRSGGGRFGDDGNLIEPFTPEDEHLLASFASQAGVALENRMLLDSIQRLFAGFVDASVKAIEARDPTTLGHSERVANLTVGLAEAISEIQVGRWKGVRFTPEQLTEIRYAGLLHDFGKIGVREHVLIKPKKLYDWKLQEVRSRFRLARQMIENQYLQRKLSVIVTQGQAAYDLQEVGLNLACSRELQELDEALQIVLQANEPSILEEERFQMLMQVATRRVKAADGEVIPLVAEDELKTLSIRRGSLDAEERREIERHVSHSYDFLIKIPWTKDLQNVPDIAFAHHEKLNGTGYPRRLTADSIPIQAKMMTISDIFDALTAADRPYKPAVPLPRALDILGYEAREGSIDGDLFEIFVQRGVYRLATVPRTGPAEIASMRSAG